MSVFHKLKQALQLALLIILFAINISQAQLDSNKYKYIMQCAREGVLENNADTFYKNVKKIQESNFELYKPLLRKIVTKSKEQHNQIVEGITLLSLGKILYVQDSFPEYQHYFYNAVQLLKQSKHTEYLQAAYFYCAVLQIRNKNKDSAHYFWEEYYKLPESKYTDTVLIQNYLKTAIELRRGGMYDLSLKYASKAIDICNEKKITENLGSIYMQYAEIFDFTNFDSLAYEYKIKSLENSNASMNFFDFHSIVLKVYPAVLSNKNTNWQNKIIKIYDSLQASEYAKSKGVQKAINHFRFLENYHLQQYNKALDYLNKNLAEMPYIENTVYSYYLLEAGNCYSGMQNYGMAIRFYDSCFAIAKKKNFIQVLYELLPNYYTVADKLGNKDLSLELKTKFISVLNEINSEKNIAQMSLMQSMMEDQNKTQLISLLQKDNALKKSDLRQTNFTKWVLAFIGLLLGGFAIYLIRNLRKQKQYNQLLQDQKNEIEKQSTDLYNQASAIGRLKAQMNPHFIYNAINSVQHYALQNNTEQVHQYLQQFSKLMRTTLENSEREYISIENELKYLQDYIAFEQLKNRNAFEYEIFVDESIDKENVLIPPMILQPLIENSIKHALPFAAQPKLIVAINLIKSQQTFIEITISDNGPGLKEKQHNIYKPESHISKGTLITQQRIEDALAKQKLHVVGYEIKNLKQGVINIVRLPLIEEF